MDVPSARAPGKGRRKVEIAKIENKMNRSVTFSKRCKGLIKKAEELGTLTGSEVGLIVFSPGGKPFSFGNPSIDNILTRYFASPNDAVTPYILDMERRRASERTAELHDRLMMVTAALEEEERRGKELEVRLLMQEGEMKVEEMAERELIEVIPKMENLKKEIVIQIERLKENGRMMMVGGGSSGIDQFPAVKAEETAVAYDPQTVSRLQAGADSMAGVTATGFYHHQPSSGGAVSFQSGGSVSPDVNYLPTSELGNWAFMKSSSFNGQFGSN